MGAVIERETPFLAAALGMMFSLGFYGVAWLTPWGPIQRYFLGHPISIAATILFWFAVAVLICKWFAVIDQRLRLSTIRDEDLLPSEASGSPAEQWLEGHDARHVSQRWLAELTRHPDGTRASRLVQRLEELLVRQSQRGTTKHLADDLRELSGRDADAAHDSLGLVRIIVWAIPMLGFLGTVIGITQTLGGLDFSNGTAAVDNLKSGLYVAFDTTALGLVLSVLAIFLQFPVERSEQRFLQLVDGRVGHLVSACLPSDEASDNQTVLIADLCRGVQAACCRVAGEPGAALARDDRYCPIAMAVGARREQPSGFGSDRGYVSSRASRARRIDGHLVACFSRTAFCRVPAMANHTRRSRQPAARNQRGVRRSTDRID